MHPLEKTPVREAFPWLGAATCYKKQDPAMASQVSDNEAPLTGHKDTIFINGKEIKKRTPKKKKNPLGDKAHEANPIAKLGFGIVAYINLLWCLVLTFLIYSIMLYPTMLNFGKGTAYDSVPAAVKSGYLDGYLGNMGYSSV